MNIFLTPVYIKSPVALQRCMTHLNGMALKLLRGGKLFKKILSELEKSQYYSEEELRQLQRERLKAIIHHSYQNVPYYRRLFKELHLLPSDFKDVSDLAKLPLISKKIVKQNPDDFLAANFNKRFLRKVVTSGTTGSPLKLYRDFYSINFDNAIIKRQHKWAGFNAEDKKLVLRSNPIVPLNIKKPPFWRYDFINHSLLASVYHISRQNIEYYAREILRYRPAALDAVPSSAYLLARFMNDSNLHVNFKYIFTSSEVLIPHQKDFMETHFNAKIFDYYGLAERVTAIGMCEKGNYHIYPEYGITEFLPTNKEGVLEVVGTTLNNFAMPFLRYRTGDLVRLSSQKCPCARNFQTVKTIDGRKTEDCFVTKDGRHISLFCSILSMNVKDVIETQFVQEEIDRLKVRIVTGERYSVSDELAIKGNIRKYLGDEIDIDMEKVDSIPRTEGGKFKQFVSKMESRI